ncbi:MAG: hypothetical protein WD065_19380, partial [Planctomycetaceae bacterium]
MTIAPVDPTDDQAEPTVEKPAAVSPNVSPKSMVLQEETTADDSAAVDDVPALRQNDEKIVEWTSPPPKKRRRKSIRLAAIWWQRGCWKIGQTYHRFPGWTAATFAAGVAVVLSLLLLLIHFVWTAGPEDQNSSVAISDDAAESETLDELELIAEL